MQLQIHHQKDIKEVSEFWNTTAEWRLTYFEKLKQQPDSSLSEPIRLEKEFVLAEENRIHELVRNSCTILELGCGVGRSLFTVMTRWRGKKFYGIDIAAGQLRAFRRQIQIRNLSNGLPIVANATHLPFFDSSFDLVLVCNQTFGNFLGDDRISCLREMRRVLCNKGKIMIGRFTRIEFAYDCYQEWSVKCNYVDLQTGFVSLEHYNSLWQRECDTNAILADFGFQLTHSVKAGLGFINTYEKETQVFPPG